MSSDNIFNNIIMFPQSPRSVIKPIPQLLPPCVTFFYSIDIFLVVSPPPPAYLLFLPIPCCEVWQSGPVHCAVQVHVNPLLPSVQVPPF